MKKLTLFILLLIATLSLFPDPLLAEKQKDNSVGVLSETYFVVVQSRGTDDSSVMLCTDVIGPISPRKVKRATKKE